MNLSKYTLAATLLLATASSSSASHVQCNTNGSGSCPRNTMAYVCEEGQNMCCTWTNLPQRRVDEMTSEIDLPKYGNCQRYKQSTNGNKDHKNRDNINIPPPTPAELRQKRRACNRGGGDGLDAVMKVFKNDCNNALGRNFERKVNNNWTRRTGNTWLSNAYNECAEEAVKDKLARIAEQCESSSEVADDCNDLGLQVASSIIQSSHVCPRDYYGAEDSSTTPVKKFRRECIKVAIGVCQGNIKSEAEDMCGASLGLAKQQVFSLAESLAEGSEEDDLLGTSWTATSIVKEGVVWPVLKTYPATLTFNEDGTYTASGGCLERSGKVEMSTSEFEFDNYEMSITMKCDDISVDAQEQAFEEAVLDQESLLYSIDQQVLTLYDEDGEMKAAFVPLTKSKMIKKHHGPTERATGSLRATLSTH